MVFMGRRGVLLGGHLGFWDSLWQSPGKPSLGIVWRAVFGNARVLVAVLGYLGGCWFFLKPVNLENLLQDLVQGFCFGGRAF